MIDSTVDAIVDEAFREQSDNLFGKGVEGRLDGYIRNHDHRTAEGRKTREEKAEERERAAQEKEWERQRVALARAREKATEQDRRDSERREQLRRERAEELRRWRVANRKADAMRTPPPVTGPEAALKPMSESEAEAIIHELRCVMDIRDEQNGNLRRAYTQLKTENQHLLRQIHEGQALKETAHFEVVALYDENRQGRSGFADTLSGNKDVYKSLQLRPELFQPGTQIIVKVAQCPQCERPTTEHAEGICPCGHDWITWCQERYAKFETVNESSEQQDQTG